MSALNAYTTRDEAIQREVIDPIEARGVVSDAAAEFDIEAIADEVIAQTGSIRGAVLFERTVDSDEFWQIVQKHAND